MTVLLAVGEATGLIPERKLATSALSLPEMLILTGLIDVGCFQTEAYFSPTFPSKWKLFFCFKLSDDVRILSMTAAIHVISPRAARGVELGSDFKMAPGLLHSVLYPLLIL